MTGEAETLRRSVEIVNRLGLHARAATRFVQTASNFTASIVVVKDGERADGKSVINLLTLAAAQGTVLELEASGDDASEALEALAALIADRFDEAS